MNPAADPLNEFGSVEQISNCPVAPETPLSEAIWVMVEQMVHSLPVIEEGKRIGIITHTDVLIWAAEKLA